MSLGSWTRWRRKRTHKLCIRKKMPLRIRNPILLSKLSTYFIQENAQYNWFKSFLKNRTQICFVSGSLSKTCSRHHIGSSIVLLYINDLPKCLSNSYPRIYAVIRILITTLIRMWLSFSPVWMKIWKISANGWSQTNSNLIRPRLSLC